MMQQTESQKVVCSGGLNSNVNHIQLSDNEPGSAVDLLNFETSLYGGYRRLTGFGVYNNVSSVVDSVGAEGRILTVAIFGSTVITARKQKGSNTYAFYQANSGWVKYTTGLTRNSLGVTRIRWATFNFNGTEKIIFVDGVNPAVVFDGTKWYELKSTNTGTDTSPGGNQLIDAPRYVEIFKNHIFLAQDNLVVNSSPLSDVDWTAAGGAGQLPAGFRVNQIKMFRDSLYVFGVNNIKNVTISGTDFVLNETANNIGCLSSDSVQEIGGNLVFLSQDGMRPISGTDRIGDIELESISRKIQQLLTEEMTVSDLEEAVSVVIRGKSQYRLFFSSPNKSAPDTRGIIGCLRAANGGVNWEWGSLKGIRASCTTSRYVGARELILHGDYNGVVYRQEVGNTFAGEPVTAIYATPYLDFGDAGLRKTMHKIRLFVRPEGMLSINTRLTYDWEDADKLNPDAYIIEKASPDSVSIYGTAIYDQSTYSSLPVPVLVSNVEGSGNSVQMTYYTSDTNPPYTIQGALYEFNVEGKK